MTSPVKKEMQSDEHGPGNSVRTFIPTTHPSSMINLAGGGSASSKKQARITSTPGVTHHSKRASIGQVQQSNTISRSSKKKKPQTQVKKRVNVFRLSPRKPSEPQQLQNISVKPTQTEEDETSPVENSQSAEKQPEVRKPQIEVTVDDHLMPSLGVSLTQAIDDKNLIELRRGKQVSVSQRMQAFLRKNLNFEETKGFQRRPEDYQIEAKEESVLELEDPSMVDMRQDSYTIADDHSNPETLVTQIGVEETNIKRLGVSRTATKAHLAGSLTERQTRLMLLGAATNDTQVQLETSVQAEGPTLAKKTFQRLGSATRHINIENGQISGGAAGLRSMSTTKRMSLGHQSLDRSSSLQISGRTQVSPFLQKALINCEGEMTSTELGEKLQKLKSLDKIDVSQNKITKVPYLELLNHAQTLTYLCLNNNQLTDISEDTLRNLPQLATLKLRANKLNKLPDSLFQLSNLRILDVSSNKLTSLSAKVSLLRHLQWLNISENRFEGLPNSIGYLDKLETITSEFFVYLEDQQQGGAKGSNLQVESTGDPELDWITRHHQRQTMSKNAQDNRFPKLMEFMRLQIGVVSTFFDLLHEFQHVEGDYFMIMDSNQQQQIAPQQVVNSDNQQVDLVTDESEQLLKSCLSFNQMQSPSQMFDQPLNSEPSKDLTPASLLAFGSYLPRSQYNELVTVFKTLTPNRQNSSNTMLHLLVTHNHPHLLKQYMNGIQKVVTNMSETLQSSESRKQFPTPYAQQNIIKNLQVHFANKVRAAVNGVNERGLSVLDIVLQSMQNDIADAFISFCGKYLDLECHTDFCSSPSSEIRVIVPGNQQSNQPQQLQVHPAAVNKLHPIVSTLLSGRFHLTSKLIDIALDFHLKRRAHDSARKRYDSLLKEPNASQQSLAISSLVQNHAALQQTLKNTPDLTNAPFNLNLGDTETGMTYLHHLFANFDTNPEKAGNLFRKLNSLHVRHANTTTGTLGSRGVKSIVPRSPDNRTIQLKGAENGKQLTLTGSIDTKISASQQRLFVPSNPSIAKFGVGQAESPRQGHHQWQGPEIEPLELNPMTHYYETPFDLAVEHFQHSAVKFALTWNYNNIQSIRSSNQPGKYRSTSAKRSHAGGAPTGPLSALERQLNFSRVTKEGCFDEGNSTRQFFDVMCQENSRRLTPLHRVVINGNYNALKIILDSPLFHEAHTYEKDLDSDLRSRTLIDLHALDKLGREPRDYAHKIVFMSKLLSQANCRQIWHQANLFNIKKMLTKQRQQQTNHVQTKGKLATYDKLISHTSLSARSKSKRLAMSVQTSQIIGGGLLGGDHMMFTHTCLNAYFLKNDAANRVKYSSHFKKESEMQIRKQFQTEKQQKSGAQSHHPSSDRRLAKSFASNSNTPVYHKGTPRQGHVKGKSIFSTDFDNQARPESPLKSYQSNANGANSRGGGVIHRQAIPQSIPGFKKTKSMAFNSTLKSRTDRIGYLKSANFENGAIDRKMLKHDTRQFQKSQNGMIGDQTSATFLQQFSRALNSGAHSSLGIHERQGSQGSLVIVKEQGGNLEARYGKTESVMSAREQQQLFKQLENVNPMATRNDSDESLTVLENGEESKRVTEFTEVAEGDMGPTLDLGAKWTPSSRPQAIKRLKKPSPRHGVKHGQQSFVYGKMLDQSSMTIATDLLKAGTCHTPFLKKDVAAKKDHIPDNKSAALQLADLEGVKQPRNKAETSMEITHDFNDSGSANSFTPLPSIQNDYALEIKSFNNQCKKPYTQQLQTNRFKEKFDLIMDNHVHQPITTTNTNNFYDIDITASDRRGETKEPQPNTYTTKPPSVPSKPLKPHEKMQLLFQIVREAKRPDKLQDAKDIFDFIQYEISQQAQFAKALTTATASKDDNASQKDKTQLAQPGHLAAQAPGKKQQKQLTEPAERNVLKASQQGVVNKAIAHMIRVNDDIVFLQQEVNHLRCQLDLMSKQLVAIPSHVKMPPTPTATIPSLSIYQSVSQANDGMGAQPYTKEYQTHNSSMLGQTSTYNRKIAFSNRNPSIAGTEINTATELIDVAHLTEADEDSSQDFDENLNTIRQATRKKATMVKPSEILGAKSQKHTSAKKGLKQSKLSSLLGTTSGKRGDQPQKVLMSKKRKSLKQVDSNSFIKSQQSRENLETDEGQTSVNQPLVSADVQSFSDRLSHHHRGDSISTRQGISSNTQRFKQKSLLEIANRNAQAFPRSTGSVQITTESATDKSFTQMQPKLKYAAFAQIDLSTFDFQRRNPSGQVTAEPLLLHEKSRSAIGISQVKMLSTSRGGEVERPHTRVGSEPSSSIHAVKVEQTSSFLDNTGDTNRILSTEEKLSRGKFMSIQEGDFSKLVDAIQKSTQQPQHKKSLLKRSDSYKGISATTTNVNAKVAPTASSTTKMIGPMKKKMSTNVAKKTAPSSVNFGALTSQKVGLRVLQDYQKSKTVKVGHIIDSHHSSYQPSAASTQQLKPHESTDKLQHMNTLSLKPPAKLDHLTTASISLPTSTKNNQLQATSSLMQKSIKMSALGAKTGYIQPKISRGNPTTSTVTLANNPEHTASQNRVSMQTMPRQIRLKMQGSRNGAAGIPAQTTGQQTVMRTIDGAPGQLKIKTHHRLLKDLIDNSRTSVTRTRGGGTQNGGSK